MSYKYKIAIDEMPLDKIHIYVYFLIMKRRELEKKLTSLGWWMDRHADINENLARKILKAAKRICNAKREV